MPTQFQLRVAPRAPLVFLVLPFVLLMAAACHDPRQTAVSSDAQSAGTPQDTAGRGEGVAGLVTAAGQPAEGLMVQAASLDEPSQPIPEIAVLTGEDGRYAWPLPPGRYRLSVSLDGFQPASGSVTVEAGRRATLNLALERRP